MLGCASVREDTLSRYGSCRTPRVLKLIGTIRA